MKNSREMFHPYLKPGFLPLLASLALMLVAAAIGCWQIFFISEEKDAAAAIWLWGAIMAWSTYAGYYRAGRVVVWPTWKAKMVAWILLLLLVLLHYCGWYDPNLFLLFAAVICYIGGGVVIAAVGVPLFLWLVVIPLLPYFHFLLSYPLRLIGSQITVPIVRLFGIAVDSTGTIINMGDRSIAITAACSEIGRAHV